MNPTSEHLIYKANINSLQVGNFLPRQEINKETLDLNNTLNQMILTHILRTFHLTAAQHTLFSSAHAVLFRRDHIEVPQK